MNDRYPPGPRDWLLGIPQVFEVRRDLLGWYGGLQKRYGDVVSTRLGPYHLYVLFHPDEIREVLVTNARSFHMTPRVRNIFAQWIGNGLLLSEGDFWARQKRLMRPAFSPARFSTYGDMMVGQTEQLLEGWDARTRPPGGLENEVGEAMTGLTLRIVAQTLFGVEKFENPDEFGHAVAILSEVALREIESLLHTPGWVPTAANRKKRSAIDLLDRTVRGFIRERRASGEDRGDLLSMLLLAVDEEDGSARMTDEQIRDECMTLLLAGHDTTAAGLTWVFYNLARHQQAQAALIEEVDRALGGRLPTFDDLPNLPYTAMVIKETLRLFPPAIGVFQREALADVEIGGYQIRRGSLVQSLSFFPQRDARWFSDPEQFKPERFAPGELENLPQFAYFPFGGGPRSCIGDRFASTEMALVVATMMQRLSVELAPDQGAPKLRVLVSTRPDGGLRLVWKRRFSTRPATARSPVTSTVSEQHI